jgi:hypothetical protein
LHRPAWNSGDRKQAAADGSPASAAGGAVSTVKGVFRDRRTALFAVATVSGVLALLLMLGWQLSHLATKTSAAAGGETPDDDAAGLRNSHVAAAFPEAVQERSKEEPSDTSHRVRVADPDPAHSGTPSIAKSPPDAPQADDPFGAAAGEPGNHGATGVPHARQDAPSPGAVTRAGPPLGLEIVRTSVSSASQPDLRFLVTSVGADGKSATGLSRNGTNEEPASTIEGWLPTRDNPADPTIVRTRHGQPSPAGIAVTATANARWTVAAPKLKLEIVLPRRITVGSRVPVRLRVTNIGTAAAAAVTLHVDLPAELSYDLGRRLSHDVGELAPGAVREARLTAVAKSSGEASISATVFCNGDRASSARTRSILPSPRS